ncbi:MAG: hypothetical protein CVV27_04905 [Candidatus Melainabacteria bacterium HGW-Melainabacteria-1]|nr:MAG: hypothetical protein CVV27_04905 [Candidatus Melainabacteria bacterium HGW-Melainabacteria-1]
MAVIFHSLHLPLPPARAFELLSEPAHLERWLCESARVELRDGGRFELFWDLDQPDRNSTLGCRILCLRVPYQLCFEWKGPPQFDALMNHLEPLTAVTLTCFVQADGSLLCLQHGGWPAGAEEARRWFSAVWSHALQRLQDYAAEIDQLS